MNKQTKNEHVYRCPECGDEVTMDSDVAPDDPACPSCWSGWDEPFPVMHRV